MVNIVVLFVAHVCMFSLKKHSIAWQVLDLYIYVLINQDFNMSVLAANMHRNSKWEVIKVAFLHPLLIVNWLKMFHFETPKIVEVHMQVNLLASSNCAKESYHGESVHPSYSLGG